MINVIYEIQCCSQSKWKSKNDIDNQSVDLNRNLKYRRFIWTPLLVNLDCFRSNQNYLKDTIKTFMSGLASFVHFSKHEHIKRTRTRERESERERERETALDPPNLVRLKCSLMLGNVEIR